MKRTFALVVSGVLLVGAAFFLGYAMYTIMLTNEQIVAYMSQTGTLTSSEMFLAHVSNASPNILNALYLLAAGCVVFLLAPKKDTVAQGDIVSIAFEEDFSAAPVQEPIEDVQDAFSEEVPAEEDAD